LKDGDPRIEHGEGSEEQGRGTDVIDDDRGDLDGLAEPHVIALETTAYKNGVITLTSGNLCAMKLFVKHPVNAVKLMGEVGEILPQRVDGHDGVSRIVITKKREREQSFSIFFHSVVRFVWITIKKRGKVLSLFLGCVFMLLL
jgi:hypothetical protein